uniref:Uncharacterized protein n=1 Tax=Medicago truncatula TaxID=3880 RepID=I3SZ87_MEDTR|nr:unknown [Medicago truncatula]
MFPLEPVKGDIFPILIIDLANCSKKRSFLSAYNFTNSADS